MASGKFQLAQINIGRAIAPLDDLRMAEFVSQLDGLNALAEQSPGFIWRLKDESGASSSYVQAYEDARMLVNLSVWESIETLEDFAYRSAHAAAFRDRRKWFEPLTIPVLALWWIPAGSIPTPAEGRERLECLAGDGPTEYAFNFRKSFAAPD